MYEQIANWLWNHITPKWDKAPAVTSHIRLTQGGQAVAGPCKLCWIACNPSAGLSVWELTDDLTGLTATVLDCYSTARETKGFNFIPPMNFANGIYLKTFTNMTSCVFGYIP